MSPLTASKQSSVEIRGYGSCFEIRTQLVERGIISCCYANTQAHSTKQKKNGFKLHTQQCRQMLTKRNTYTHHIYSLVGLPLVLGDEWNQRPRV